eukprot:2033226-Prymnesium_polylepis.1
MVVAVVRVLVDQHAVAEVDQMRATLDERVECSQAHLRAHAHVQVAQPVGCTAHKQPVRRTNA